MKGVMLGINPAARLTGEKCGSCRFKYLCGGWRGRAYAHSGDYPGDDPLCFLYSDATPVP